MSDNAGAVTDTYQYDAFGAIENKIGATENSYRYTGEHFDEVIGLQYNRARWYAPLVGRFTAADEYSGNSVNPISLNKFVYADSDPVNRNDPSGFTTNTSELGAGASVSGTLNTVATPNIVRHFSGKAANEAGKAFTNKIRDAIQGCLKPGVIFKSGNDVPKIPAKVTNGKTEWAMPDFMFQLGDKFKYLEGKTKLPGINSIGDQFERVGRQLQAAINKNAPIGVVTKTKHRDPTLEKRKQDILNTLTGDASLTTFLNGMTGMIAFVSEYVVEECVENALRRR